MEAVQKKISLEPFRSRQKSSIPFVGMESGKPYMNLNWGEVAYGVNFNDPDYWAYDSEENEMVRIPSLYELSGETAVYLYGEGIRELGALNFTELMDYYHTAINDREYIESIDDEEFEKFKSVVAFVNEKRVIEIPASRPDPCCYPCYNPPVPDEDEMDEGEYYIPSVANINICLVQNANIVGAYTFATKDWKEGKRYFPGDKTLYDGHTYKLKDFMDVNARINGSKSNCQGQPLMQNVGFYTASSINDFAQYNYSSYVDLSDSLFNEFIVKSEEEIVDMGYIYAKMEASEGEWIYYIRPSWGGYNNNYDGMVYFDVLYSDKSPEMGFRMHGEYNTEHWELASDIISYGEYTVSGCGTDIHISGGQARDIGFDDVLLTGVSWESKLVNFIRNTKSVDAYGNQLPGKIASLSTSKIIDLPYLIGTVKNIDTSGDIPIGDYLADITIVPDNQPGFRIQPTGGTEDEYNIIADNLLEEYMESGDTGNTNFVLFQTLNTYEDIVKNWSGEGREDETGAIYFKYYIGAELEREKDINGNVDKDADYIYNGGKRRLIYEDAYRFTARTMTIDTENMDGSINSGVSYVYLDIDYDSSSEEVFLENIDNYEVTSIKSMVTATTQSITEGGNPLSNNFQNADYFMEDYQLGLSFVANNNENVYIDRGDATAFERHMRLSEVDTMQDLETYGNSMFKLKE